MNDGLVYLPVFRPRRYAIVCHFWMGFCLVAGLPAVARGDSPATVVVAPDGDDQHDGTLERPLRTLAAAQQAVRRLRSRGATGEPVTVYLRAGTYYLAEPILLGTADSGREGGPVVWSSWAGEQAVISGGQRLQLTWHEMGSGVWRAEVPTGTVIDQLFVNGELQRMARYPNFDSAAQYYGGVAADALSPERVGRWKSPAGGFIHAMHSAEWGDFHYLITGKDVSQNLQYEGGWQNNRQMGMHAERRFVEHIREELDVPHEWYFDAAESMLYYQPPESVELKDAVIESVRLKTLFDFVGASHIELKGLKLVHAARTFMENREPLLRSDWTTYRGGTVRFADSVDCGVADCWFDQVGGNAIFVDGRNRRLRITGNRIEGVGASGISFVGRAESLRSPLFEYHQTQELESMDRTPGSRDDNYPVDCLVEDNLICRVGRVEKQTAGINLCMAARIVLRHNSIYEVPRAGINICDGAFGGNLVEGNDIFDTVLETGDHGSFNSWGRDRFWHPDRTVTESWVKQYPDMPLWECREPNVLRNNRWRCDHGWDIDLDDGSSNYLLYNNLCLAGGIKLREGYRRRVWNNILVDYTFCPHVWYANCDSWFQQNIVWVDGYAPAGMNVADFAQHLDYNFVHVPGMMDVEPALGLRGEGTNDQHSWRGDARFVDPLAGDYRISDDSPARRTGFQSFPMDEFGVRSPRLRAIARTPVLPGSLAAARVRSGGWGRDYRLPGSAQWLGATVKNLETPGEHSATGLGADHRGVLVTKVPASSPAAERGLQSMDVVLEIDGHAVPDLAQLAEQWEASADGAIVVWRNQGRVTVERRAP